MAFTTFMYIAPMYLLRSVMSSHATYITLWLVAAIITVIPILPVNRSKESFGVLVYIASGLIANIVQIVVSRFVCCVYVLLSQERTVRAWAASVRVLALILNSFC